MFGYLFGLPGPQLLPMHALDFTVVFLRLFCFNQRLRRPGGNRFVQVPPCSPALSSPAANDEHVNAKPLKKARSLL